MCSFRNLIFFFIFTCCFSSSYSQEVILIESDFKSDLVAKMVYCLEDSTGTLQIEDILKQEQQVLFKPNESNIFSKAPSKNTYWLKLKVKNITGKEAAIELNTSSIWFVDYYLKRGDGFEKILETGALRPEESKAYPVNLFWLPLEPGEKEQEIYIRINSELAMGTPIKAGTIIALSKDKFLDDMVVGSFVGIMLIMFFYNLFLLFSLKDLVYVWYILYIATSLNNVTFFNNYPFSIYIFPDLKYFLLYYFPSWIWMAYLTPSFFTIYFLDLHKKNLFLTAIILLFNLAFAVVIPLLNLLDLVPLPQLLNLVSQLVQLLFLLLTLIGIYLWVFKRSRKAVYYTIGWIWVTLGGFIWVFILDGSLEYNFITRNAVFLGHSLEIMFFSIALGDRINLLRKEKDTSQVLLLQKSLENEKLISEKKEELEILVDERTKELQLSREEVLTQNEELQQTQEEIKTQRDFLDKQNQLLSNQNNKIESSIRAAEMIQQAIMPYKSKLERLLHEYFIIYHPKDVVSGDFYWLNEADGKIVLVVADCTGHGVPGAFMTLIGNNLLEKIIRVWDITSPAEILKRMHEEIRTLLKQKYTRNHNGMDAVVITIEKKADGMQILFCGAKNDLLYFNPEKNEIEELKGIRKSIGGEQNEQIDFVNTSLILPYGSMLYLGTDGLEDQNNKQRKRFGKERLKSILKENVSKPMSEQKECIESELASFMQGVEQRDDMLWLGFKIDR